MMTPIGNRSGALAPSSSLQPHRMLHTELVCPDPTWIMSTTTIMTAATPFMLWFSFSLGLGDLSCRSYIGAECRQGIKY
ncbi:hypothetical protein LINPERHAP1_LOCUS38332 [Linum perenne]